MYGKLLRTLEKMPETAAYRLNTQEQVKSRADALERNKGDMSALEAEIGCGQVLWSSCHIPQKENNVSQVEELMVQAENELILARKFVKWKPWEPLVEKAPKNQWQWPI